MPLAGVVPLDAVRLLLACVELFRGFCQGSRHYPWPTRARLGIGPLLTEGRTKLPSPLLPPPPACSRRSPQTPPPPEECDGGGYPAGRVTLDWLIPAQAILAGASPDRTHGSVLSGLVPASIACALGRMMTSCHAACRIASTVMARRRNWSLRQSA